MSRIYYTKPSITELEVAYARDAAENGWGPNCYTYISKFEDAFARHIGRKYAVATSSCTGAMHLGLAALGIGPGDEVIVADINWIASVAPVLYLGAKPVLVDIKSDTWCIDPEAVLAAITPRTKAIIAVHLYGSLADMTKLGEIANEHGLHLIEDAAEAIGSQIGAQLAGSMGDFSIFSFHGTKTLTTGEGGMLLTDDPEIFDKVLTLNNHGRSRAETKQFWSSTIGYKYKISNIQAAIGLAQTERVSELVAQKRSIFQSYRDILSDLPIAMNVEHVGTTNGYWMPTVIVHQDVKFDRDGLIQLFQKNEIDGRVFFWPLSSLPMFEREIENPVGYGLYARAFNLPSYHDMTQADIERVCGLVRDTLV